MRLPEDSVLSGFTPLTYTAQETMYAPKELEPDRAQFSLRLFKLVFFGTVYLCGVDPPVLKLEIEDGVREYVSVVCLSNSRDSPPTPEELVSKNNEYKSLHDNNLDTRNSVRYLKSVIDLK